MHLENTPSPSIFIQCYRIPEGCVSEMFTLTVSLVSCLSSLDPSAGLSLRFYADGADSDHGPLCKVIDIWRESKRGEGDMAV